MSETHPNIEVLSRFDPANVAGATEVLADDFVWHFFNPRLPDLQGDYVGRDALQGFFEQMAQRSHGSFRVNPVSITPVGDELVVVHSRNTMTMEGKAMEMDAVVVWRIVNGQITEAWDIPAVNTIRSGQ